MSFPGYQYHVYLLIYLCLLVLCPHRCRDYLNPRLKTGEWLMIMFIVHTCHQMDCNEYTMITSGQIINLIMN